MLIRYKSFHRRVLEHFRQLGFIESEISRAPRRGWIRKAASDVQLIFSFSDLKNGDNYIVICGSWFLGLMSRKVIVYKLVDDRHELVKRLS